MGFLKRIFALPGSMAEVGAMMFADNARDAKKRLKKAGYYKHDFVCVGESADCFRDHIIKWYWCRNCGKYFEKYMAYGGLCRFEEETRPDTIKKLEEYRDKILKEETDG